MALQKSFDKGRHDAGADQQRLLSAAPAQQAVGEDMAAIEIRRELHLVNRDEIDV